jgi:hypothetical protein
MPSTQDTIARGSAYSVLKIMPSPSGAGSLVPASPKWRITYQSTLPEIHTRAVPTLSPSCHGLRVA